MILPRHFSLPNALSLSHSPSTPQWRGYPSEYDLQLSTARRVNPSEHSNPGYSQQLPVHTAAQEKQGEAHRDQIHCTRLLSWPVYSSGALIMIHILNNVKQIIFPHVCNMFILYVLRVIPILSHVTVTTYCEYLSLITLSLEALVGTDLFITLLLRNQSISLYDQ